MNAYIIIGLTQYFEADFLWKVSLKMLNARIILKTFSPMEYIWFYKRASQNYLHCFSKMADQFNQSASPICLYSQDSAKTYGPAHFDMLVLTIGPDNEILFA